MRSEYNKYELFVIKEAQKESYQNEYDDLLNGKEVRQKSEIYKVLPYLDKNGIIRSNTRISNTEENVEKFGLDRINPIILHRDSHLTKLIIMKAHNAMVHINEKTVVINLLQRFFINKIRRTVNNVIRNNCLECRITHARPFAPLMGDIPFTRLAFYKHTFTYAMADLFGPISVKYTRFTTHKHLRLILIYRLNLGLTINLMLNPKINNKSHVKSED